jgi:oxygen-dependent protoporphyrinogen oxidase
LNYESVEDLTVSRLGEEFFQKLVEPVVSGVHGQSAKTISAQRIFGSVIEKAKELDSLTAAVGFLRPKNSRPGSAVGSIRGGMNVVINTLQKSLEDLGVNIITGSAVESMSLSSVWEIETKQKSFNADCLVIASGQVFDPEGSRLVDVPKNQTSLVSAIVQSDELNEFALGPGALLAQNGDGPKATTHLNSKWPWLREVLDPSIHAIRLSFAGAVEPDKASVSEWIEKTYAVTDAEVLDFRVDTWSSPQTFSFDPAVNASLGYVGSLVSGNGLTAIAKSHLERSAK